jgi:hypothetical protein
VRSQVSGEKEIKIEISEKARKSLKRAERNFSELSNFRLDGIFV